MTPMMSLLVLNNPSPELPRHSNVRSVSFRLTLPRYFFRNPKNIPTAPAPVDGRYPERICLSP